MKTILAFGDSNTYGLNPHGGSRFDADTRWPALLGKALAPHGYKIAEDGLCGRTTVFADPVREGRRGIDALHLSLCVYRPDIVILMLGTNDCKTAFHAAPAEIAEGVRKLIGIVRKESDAEILLLSPIHLGEDVPDYDPDFDADSVARSKGLRAAYAAVAAEEHCAFLAASDYALPSAADREHLDEEGHLALAAALTAYFTG